MALTAEIIKANESLSGLTEDQITAISTLSANDENTVIGAKIGEVHGKYDADVMAVAGVEKNQGEKTYDYVKRVLGDFKTKGSGTDALKTELDAAKAEAVTLRQQIADGKGNEAMAQQLKDAQGKASALQTQYDTDKAAWGTKESEYSKQITSIQVDVQFEKATSGLKFKAEYPADIQDVLVNNAKNAILAEYKPDWIDGGNGKKVMVFRDAKGDIARNMANGLNPFTATELIASKLKTVIDSGRKVEGAGTGPANVGKVEMVDIAGAKTQVQADEIISKYLMQTGETKGSASFATKQAKLRADAGVSKLPMR